jgi:hypothetical protein
LEGDLNIRIVLVTPMSIALATAPLTIAGHAVTLQDRAGGMITLRLALPVPGAPLVAMARALAQLDGVHVASGPESPGRERGYVVRCPGFKMVLIAPAAETPDHALALVSRSPQAALAVMSDLGDLLERLMTAPPPPPAERAPATPRAPRPALGSSRGPEGAGSSSLRRSGLAPGKPLARKTQLQRKTPLARGRFKRPGQVSDP